MRLRKRVSHGTVVLLGCGCLDGAVPADGPAVAGPAISVDVRSLGAAGDGTTKDTAAFQKAIDQCAAGGGGVVNAPSGNYLIGSIELKAHVRLNLEAGATLRGSDDLWDYPLTDVRWEGHSVRGYRGLIYASDADDIAITGSGHIAANPKLGGREMPRRPVLIETVNCDGLHLSGFSTQHQKMWSIHPLFCKNVTIDHLTIRSNGGNGDGIDIDSCSGVVVDHCDISTGDDCIAIKSGRGLDAVRAAKPSENIQITDCTFADSDFAGVAIGSEMSGGVRQVDIRRCVFTSVHTTAIYIKSRPGRGGSIADIRGTDLKVLDSKRGFLRINLLTSGIAGDDPVPGAEGIPRASDIQFSNVSVAGGAVVDATSIPDGKPLDGLSLSHISGTCRKGILLANMTHVALSDIHVSGFKGPLLATSNVSGVGLAGAAAFDRAGNDKEGEATTEPAP